MNLTPRHPPTRLLLTLALLFTLLAAACDSPVGPDQQAPAPSEQVATPTGGVQEPTATVAARVAAPTAESQAPTAGTEATEVTDAATVASPTAEEDEPAPTEVTATSTGEEMTALQALGVLKQKALAWQADARLGLLSNVRPGQQKNLLGDAMGKPEIYEPTPDGKGRDWTLVAVSPSARGAIAIGMDGTRVDLVKAGAVTADTIDLFAGAGAAGLALSDLNVAGLADSDKIVEEARKRSKTGDVGVALLAPDGLGLGPLPTPQAGGAPPQLAYELFNSDSYQQSFIFFDAKTGAVVLDSSSP
ncbi:MAG: hypothetical protein ACJ78Q_02020 [Chloroflexia bacterium]